MSKKVELSISAYAILKEKNLTDLEIRNQLGVSKAALNKWKKEHGLIHQFYASTELVKSKNSLRSASINSDVMDIEENEQSDVELEQGEYNGSNSVGGYTHQDMVADKKERHSEQLNLFTSEDEQEYIFNIQALNKALRYKDAELEKLNSDYSQLHDYSDNLAKQIKALRRNFYQMKAERDSLLERLNAVDKDHINAAEKEATAQIKKISAQLLKMRKLNIDLLQELVDNDQKSEGMDVVS